MHPLFAPYATEALGRNIHASPNASIEISITN